MALTLEQIETRIMELEAAIDSGVLRVKFSGPPEREITYQTTDAMMRALARLEAKLAETAGTRRRFKYATHNKGC